MPDLDPALNRAPQKVQSVYLMGIGGVAMGALAGALAARGLAVRGSDNPLYPPMSDFLAGRGITVASPYHSRNLEPPPDLVIVGNVIRRSNPEVPALARLKVPYLSLPQAVAHFYLRRRRPIVVAGTHGKTTISALIYSGLHLAGKDPGLMLGGLLGPREINFHEGKGRHFVVEGDEYDTAFFDKRPKFVHYCPNIGVLSSLEFDHADIYADLTAVRRAFDLFVAQLPAEGRLIAWGDAAGVRECAAHAACPVEYYGRGPECAWRLASAEPRAQGGARLRVITPQGEQLSVETPLAGEHNALNIMAAVAALAAAGLPPKQAARVQRDFPGVARRQQVRGAAAGVLVVDDFAHHPTAVRETVAALARFGLPGWRPGSGRLVAVFEPRSNTSRRNIFQAEYVQSFDRADWILLREPGDLEEIPPAQRFSSARLAGELTARGLQAVAFANSEGILSALREGLRPGDLCLIMSNGGFDNLHSRLLAALSARDQ